MNALALPTALTYGALCGWMALVVTKHGFAPLPSGPFQVDPVTAVFAIALTGTGLWLLDIELPPALAVALLLPFAGIPPGRYTVNVAVGSTFVASLVGTWHVLADRIRRD